MEAESIMCLPSTQIGKKNTTNYKWDIYEEQVTVLQVRYSKTNSTPNVTQKDEPGFHIFLFCSQKRVRERRIGKKGKM
jgi:hypothetical protein